MGKIIPVVLLALVLFAALIVAGWLMFGVWGVLGAVLLSAAGLVLLVWMIIRSLKNLALSAFKAKGMVLRDADVFVHEIRPEPVPSPHEGETVAGACSIELAITLVEQKTPFRQWDPTELQLVNAAEAEKIKDASDLDTVGHVEKWFEWRQGTFVEANDSDDSDQNHEPVPEADRNKLKLLVHFSQIPAGPVRFRYYTELFGPVLDIPPAAFQAPAAVPHTPATATELPPSSPAPGQNAAETDAPLGFFLHRDGKNDGPYSLEQLTEMAEDGTVTEEDFVWHENLQEWKRLKEIARITPLAGEH